MLDKRFLHKLHILIFFCFQSEEGESKKFEDWERGLKNFRTGGLCYVLLCGIYLPSVVYNFVVIIQ